MADLIGDFKETSDISEDKSDNEKCISKEALDKYDELMGDNELKVDFEEEKYTNENAQELDGNELYDKLFEEDNFVINIDNDKCYVSTEINRQEVEVDDISLIKEPNSKYELNGNLYETDDNGETYKKNGELFTNAEYTINGNTYETDENGNKISCDSKPTYTDEGYRNTKEQKESGGDERQENDDGGHIIAKILGGSEGEENLVPMRRTINRGDYKKMENEIAKALQEGKKVILHIDIQYDGNSQRPAKISVEYNINGKRTVTEFDNEENSTELLDGLADKIGEDDYEELKEELNDMQESGLNASVTSVTSVKSEYDENGNLTKITVGVLHESTGEKTYKVYEPK